ncbi:MAG: DedA family protein [Azoarcus sp.]|jgi:membrane protein DedA with SNARE-associated domain|nr:DedA family protein [Azoarcus sp.]
MLNPELAAVLRKRWYVVLFVLGVVACAVWFFLNNEQDTETLLRRYGYVLILVWTFLEGETCVIIAGALAETLDLNLWLIALSAFGGSFSIDQIMFALGKYKGEAMLRYFPRMAKNVDKAAVLFKKYDIALILGFRFIYGVRNVTAILMGISKVNHAKFFILNFIGASVWALTFTFSGYYAGKAFLEVADRAGYGILFVILLVLVIIGIVWFVRSRRSAKAVPEVAQHSGDNEGP